MMKLMYLYNYIIDPKP